MKTPDYSYAVLKPYIDSGIVEWVTWPPSENGRNKFLSLVRHFKDANQEYLFKNLLYYDCLKGNNTGRHKHLHSGCQQAAVLDSVARYGSKSTWIAHFDVDEFIFQHHTNGKSTKTLRQVLQDMEEFDQVVIPGTSFGTNGFFYPVDKALDLPFPLVTEQYRFRRDKDWLHGQMNQVNAPGVTYTQKAIAKTK